MTWTLDNGTIVMQNFVDSQKVLYAFLWPKLKIGLYGVGLHLP